MNFLYGLNLKTILLLLLAIIIVFGLFKKLFKLVIFAAIIGLLLYLYSFLF